MAAATAVVASGAAALSAEAPTRVLWPLAFTMTPCATLTPLQEHVRRVLHLAGISWHAAVVSLVEVGGVLVALVLLASAETPRHLAAIWGADDRDRGVARGGLVLTLRRQPPATLPRYGMADLMRSGRWLLAIEAITAGATFLASVIVSRLDDPAALGYAEAARVVGQPIFMLAVGLPAVLNPRAMEAGAGRDRAAARHVARPFRAARDRRPGVRRPDGCPLVG
jgi:hypothetical protein